MRALIASLIAVLALSIVPEAAAKTYSAERFDSRIRILPNGAIEVVETVVFRFEGEFTARLPRTLAATHRRHRDRERRDGRPGASLRQGIGPGRGAATVKSPRRVEVCAARRLDPHLRAHLHRAWSRSARGGRDVLEWVALPTEHDYRIDESQVILELPVGAAVRPIVDSKRVAETDVRARRPARAGVRARHRQERLGQTRASSSAKARSSPPRRRGSSVSSRRARSRLAG